MLKEYAADIFLIHADLLLFDARRIWTLAAVLLAAAAAVAVALLRRPKLSILKLRKVKSLASYCGYLSEDDGEDVDVDDDESSSSDDDDEDDRYSLRDCEELENDKVYNFGGCQGNRDQNGDIWGRFYLPDLISGRSVVKAWDGLGLGFNNDCSSDEVMSVVDLSRGEIIRSFPAGNDRGGDPTAAMVSPTVIVSASSVAKTIGLAAVRAWDVRARVGSPAAEGWFSWPEIRRRAVAGIAGEGGKVFVGDRDGSLSAVDLRKTGHLVVAAAAEEDRRWNAVEVLNAYVGEDGGGIVGCAFPVLPSWN